MFLGNKVTSIFVEIHSDFLSTFFPTETAIPLPVCTPVHPSMESPRLPCLPCCFWASTLPICREGWWSTSGNSGSQTFGFFFFFNFKGQVSAATITVTLPALLCDHLLNSSKLNLKWFYKHGSHSHSGTSQEQGCGRSLWVWKEGGGGQRKWEAEVCIGEGIRSSYIPQTVMAQNSNVVYWWFCSKITMN